MQHTRCGQCVLTVDLNKKMFPIIISVEQLFGITNSDVVSRGVCSALSMYSALSMCSLIFVLSYLIQ